MCGGAVQQCTVLVVFGNGLTVDGDRRGSGRRRRGGRAPCRAVFDGAVFGLVGDDDAGNLYSRFVAVLAPCSMAASARLSSTACCREDYLRDLP